VAAVLPRIVHDGEMHRLRLDLAQLRDQGIRDVLVGNLDLLQIAREAGMRIHGDFGLNIFNSRSLAVCRELELCDDPISEIAQRHGFKDSKMLSQYFREIYDCTPSEKRKFFREVSSENQ
jgi:putative protease